MPDNVRAAPDAFLAKTPDCPWIEPVVVTLPLAVISVTPVRAPLTFPLPSKLCPQIFLAVCNLVAVAAFPVQAPELAA